MDGRADSSKIRVIDVGSDRELPLRVIPIEDLIADRMAQALSAHPLREDMKNQAISLYRFAENPDKDYLDRRIKFETGSEASLETLVHWLLS